MPRHKQMPGMTYRIMTQNESYAELEYTYLCPYCMQKATVRSTVFSPDYERLETGGFYEEVTCNECGKVTDVRFWRMMRIED